MFWSFSCVWVADVLQKSLQVLTSSSVLLQKLRLLQRTEALQRRGGVLQEQEEEEEEVNLGAETTDEAVWVQFDSFVRFICFSFPIQGNIFISLRLFVSQKSSAVKYVTINVLKSSEGFSFLHCWFVSEWWWLQTDDEDDAASSRVLRTPGPVGGLCWGWRSWWKFCRIGGEGPTLWSGCSSNRQRRSGGQRKRPTEPVLKSNTSPAFRFNIKCFLETFWAERSIVLFRTYNLLSVLLWSGRQTKRFWVN